MSTYLQDSDHVEPSSADILTWAFWEQWALRGDKPSELLNNLRNDGRIAFFPELAAMINVPQDPEWHPEGDVWRHTLLVCDAAADIAGKEQLLQADVVVLLLSSLCHDVGKPVTTTFQDGRWRAHGHPEAGVPFAEAFLIRIGCPGEIVAKILPLVAEHLVHANPAGGNSAIRRLLRRLQPATISELKRLIQADLRGRPPLDGDLPESVVDFLARAEKLSIAPLDDKDARRTGIITGQHLIALGLKPGQLFRLLLEASSAAESRGEFDNETEGLEFIRREISRSCSSD